MNKGLIGSLMFVVGAVAGAATTYLYFKNKVNTEIEAEVQKFKDDWYSEKVQEAKDERTDATNETIDISDQEKAAEVNRDKPAITDYTKAYVTKAGEEMTIEEYMDKSGLIVDVPKNHPHVISDMEFSDDMEYEKHHYVLFADGILADDDGEIVDYEEGNDNGFDYNVIYGFLIQTAIDELYYRNEELESDYEILKSARYYDGE